MSCAREAATGRRTPQTSGVTSSLYSSAYGAGTYLAVGASGVIRSSPDGTTWSTVTSPTTRDFNGILYNAANSTNNFILVGAYGGIYTSPNGINWTARPTVYGTGSSASFSSIAYGSGRFVVGASPAPGILISTNGVDWTTQLSPSSSAFKAIAWVADTFVGVGSGGSIVQAGAPDYRPCQFDGLQLRHGRKHAGPAHLDQNILHDRGSLF